MAPKAKKPLSAKAKMKLRAAKMLAKQTAAAEAAERGEVIAPKPKTSAFKAKILKNLGGKTVEEAGVEFKAQSAKAQGELHELEAVEKEKAQAVDKAKADYDKAKAAIEAAMTAEMGSAAGYKDTVAKRSEVTKKVEEARKDLYEAQRKVAMMEVLAVNHAKMKQLDEARKNAQKAAEDAKRNMLEQKQKEKDALEATKRALADARAAQKGFGKKARTAAVHPDLAETQVAADID